jgi:hypothetical protein
MSAVTKDKAKKELTREKLKSDIIQILIKDRAKKKSL